MEFVRLSPTDDDEPKNAEKPPFKAGSGLNGLVSGSLMHNAATARENAEYVDGTQILKKP